MRRNRTLIVLLLAVLSGGVAGYSALRLIQSQQFQPSPAVAEPARARVVMAARDLTKASIIGEQDVKVVDWPSGALPDGYAQTIPEVVGRGLIENVKLNEPLLDTKMTDRAGQGGMQITIPEGMQAFAVRVDEFVAVAGFVVTGTRVDLYLTVTPPGGSEPITKLIMQNVSVLSLAQNAQRDPEGNPVVVNVLTVLLTPEDGEKLIHAEAQGRIRMGLRGYLDVKEVRTTGARVAGLLSGARAAGGGGGVRPRAVSAPAEPVQQEVVEVYKAGVKTVIRFK